MKKYILFLIPLFGFILFTMNSCKKSPRVEEDKITLDSLHITEFAIQIENSIIKGDTNFYVQAFDKNYLKEKLQDNSIAYSSLDASFGKFYFDNYFTRIAASALSAIEGGGDFQFVKYYKKGDEHHIVMRAYKDFNLVINDWIVNLVDHQIKIKDGFLYNQSSTLSNDLIYYLHYNVMQITNPEGVTPILAKANGLLASGKEKEALKILDKNKDLLKQYPNYWQIYMSALYETDTKNYIAHLDLLQTEGIDPKTILLNKLLYFVNNGNSMATKQLIEKIIPLTGDDPIYLFLYGKSLSLEEDYKNALICYQNIENVLPLLWDIWCEKLDCYYQLGEAESFKKCAVLALPNFGMSEAELLDFIQLHFPAMKKLDFFPKKEQI
jgi:tetratricopeptide (TPR) repeat protein